jgi:Ogr/Delta-like zinc finger
MADISRTCPHCGSHLEKWRVPEDATWSEEFFFVCFNDDCSYYQQGWEWMKQQYNQRASYRHAVNPTSGGSLPLPVWSDSATREMIVDDAEGEGE